MRGNKRTLQRTFRTKIISSFIQETLSTIVIKNIFLLPFVLIPVYLLGPVETCQAEILLYDDLNHEIRLQKPVQRIISLTPHITELLFTAGAGDKIIGTVSHSDYPEAAKTIPRIGDAASVDIEKIIALNPDVIIVWATGTSHSILENLHQLNFPLYYSEARTLEQIALSLTKLGKLADTESVARGNSNVFLTQMNSLKQMYSKKDPVNVFYQFWYQPIFTINKNHLINDVIKLCGGRNIFSGLASLTPIVDIESVLAGNPDVIIASGQTSSPPQWLDKWNTWPEINAVKYEQLYSIPPDFLLRHTLRILKGATLMCEYIDKARSYKHSE